MSSLRGVMEESAREAGRDPSIEITMGGTTDADQALTLQDAGVGRAVVFPPTGDLDALRGVLEPFARDVIQRLS
jgi:hypothetical protein